MQNPILNVLLINLNSWEIAKIQICAFCYVPLPVISNLKRYIL